MHEHGKSDRPIVPKKAANKGEPPTGACRRSGWRKGAWPRATRFDTTGTVHRAGLACKVRWIGYDRQKVHSYPDRHLAVMTRGRSPVR